MKDIEKSFARAFASADGARVLMHLRNITIERFLGANATDAELRSLEAGRALVHQIENLIERGKNGILETLRSTWFLLAFVGGVIWWAARQSSAIDEIKKSDARITSLENRTTILESGIGQLQLKIDGIKEDLSLIKSAVIK